MVWNYNPISALGDIFLGRWTWWNLLLLIVFLGLWLLWFDKRRKEDGKSGIFEGGDWF